MALNEGKGIKQNDEQEKEKTMIKFIHTSDWQLGAGFGRVSGDGGALLRMQRIKTIETIGRVAREKGAAFILVAGDVFDSHSVGDETIVKACAALKQIALPVILITGNHDPYGQDDSLYERKTWKANCPDNVRLCDSTDPVILDDLKVVILPCPLKSKITLGNPIEHLAGVAESIGQSDYIRICLAHGSVQGFEAEDDGQYRCGIIDVDAALQLGQLDYLALGDWHGTLKIRDRVWYSGTPESDRFRNNDSGNVLLVSLEKREALPVIETIRTTTYEWIMENRDIHSSEDLASLKTFFKNIPNPESKLLRMELGGVLNLGTNQELLDILRQQRAAFLYLRDYVDIFIEPSPDEIVAISEGGFVRQAVDQLLELSKSNSQEEAGDAKLALQLLYQHAQTEEAL